MLPNPDTAPPRRIALPAASATPRCPSILFALLIIKKVWSRLSFIYKMVVANR